MTSENEMPEEIWVWVQGPQRGFHIIDEFGGTKYIRASRPLPPPYIVKEDGSVEQVKPDVNEDSLPTFKDLYGMAPNATGGIPAEDFVSNIRRKAEAYEQMLEALKMVNRLIEYGDGDAILKGSATHSIILRAIAAAETQQSPLARTMQKVAIATDVEVFMTQDQFIKWKAAKEE